ncbi:hypothetical protein [Noviherbaspirillum massiliense]|uniref:hypothetical protein n=1 Tax=Noviherbaspirillum massiliense TaxID=1465823 RepID=UPI0003185491|nr:hypothetical protein [Noviherbaspirillum massiliense]
MKKVLLAAVLLVAFFGHAKISFSEPKVMAWIANHSAKAMSGDPSACEDYTADMEVTLTAAGARGTWEVEGGKKEMCGYMRQAAAAFTVLQARTETQFDQVKITPSGFPWMSAKVNYIQRTSVNGSNLPSVTIESEDTLVLVRTLSGIKIKAIESHSTGGI